MWILRLRGVLILVRWRARRHPLILIRIRMGERAPPGRSHRRSNVRLSVVHRRSGCGPATIRLRRLLHWRLLLRRLLLLVWLVLLLLLLLRLR